MEKAKQRKLDSWVYLARFFSGMVNATMLIRMGTILTVHTGNFTRLATSFVQGDWPALITPLLAILSFGLGSFFATGYYMDAGKIMPKVFWKGYLAIALLLFIAILVPGSGYISLFLVGMAMGIEVSMPLNNRGYSGTVTRMSGIVVDFSKNLSYGLKTKNPEHFAQLKYLSVNILFYLLGAGLEALLHYHTPAADNVFLVLIPILLAFWSHRHGLSSAETAQS